MTPAGPEAAAGLGPAALDTAMLRIHDASGEPVGGGFLVTPELALTCAHVVSAALGADRGTRPDASARLRLDLPLLPSAPSVEASVEHWVPPAAGAETLGDVAVLRLHESPPGARPIRLVEARDLWGHPARAFGFPLGRSGGVWHSGVLRSRQADGWVQVDLTGAGYRVSGGFSGGPVWDENLAGAVGMMAVAEAGDPPVSYLIPTEALMAAWPPLRGLVLPSSPFRGLAAFQEADAGVFHGREKESDELAAMVRAERRVCLVGPSGSGKSSLALAGVVPRLRAEGFAVAVLRPGSGSSPLSALASALLALLEPDLGATERLLRLPGLRDALADGGLGDLVPQVLRNEGRDRLLIVVDQFEELLAQETEAVDALAGVLFTDAPPDAVRVLTTLRADFLETALAHPRIAPVVRRPVYVLGAMSEEDLRRVVTAPVAAISGVGYEDRLVDRILADTGAEPGALSLLGFTLDLLWRQQSGGLLTHAAYDELGGVPGALSAYAERVWAESVPSSEEPDAKRLFTRLISLPVGSTTATRRTALRSEMSAEEWDIARRLAATRLLVTDRDGEGVETVELAHEALIGGWDRLSAWVADDRSFLAWRGSLQHDLDRWNDAGRTPDLLPTSSTLELADRWPAERSTYLSDAERDYLRQGRLHRRARARRRQVILSGLAGLVALALVLGSLFAYQRHVSAGLDALADSRALVQSSADEAYLDPAQSVMLALAAYRASPTQEARNALLRAYLKYSWSDRTLSGLLGQVARIQASRNGDVLLARTVQGTATLFTHAADGRMRQRRLDSDTQVDFPVVAPDGERVAFVNIDGSVEWYDVRDADRGLVGAPHRLPAAPEVAENSFADNRADLSEDGALLASESSAHVVWWNLRTGGAPRRVPAPKDNDGTVWFGPDDRTVLTGVYRSGPSHTEDVVAVDLATGAKRTVATDVSGFGVSGDGNVVSFCRTGDGGAAVAARRVADGAPVGRPYTQKGENVCQLAATDVTGHHVAVGGASSMSLIDLDQGRQVSQTHLPDGVVSSYYPRLAATGGGPVLIGTADTQITYTRLSSGPGNIDVGGAALTPDGGRVVYVAKDGSRLQLRTTDGTGRPLAEAVRPKPYLVPDKADVPRFDRTGRLLAEREGESLIAVRDAASLRPTAQITVPPPPVDTTSSSTLTYFFDRADHLVTVSGTRIQLWDPRDGRRLAEFDATALHPTVAGGVPQLYVSEYTTGDEVIVLAGGDRVVHVLDLRTGRLRPDMTTGTDTIALVYDPSGRYFALLRHGSVVELWRRHPLRRELGPLPSLGNDTFVAKFLDAHGHFLLASNEAVRVYRVGARAYQQSYDFGDASDTISATHYQFLDASRNGRTVVYADGDDAGALVLDPGAWARQLCRIIGYRDFTPDERAGLPVRVPGGPTCSDTSH
ncbi:trypsin-like peptidase domain-containing protein [Actinoallomurus sp. CA-150999]|uniref:nSTAND1 domain-containing NTPase n=1 Tax=Actinoallomurus sp. CA-150999 TaxID=3239887 RepID=UPI003D8DB35B